MPRPPTVHSACASQRLAAAGDEGRGEDCGPLNEPSAASLAYGLEKKDNDTILVFDLGDSTFDVSVLEVSDGVCEVLSTNGDTHLGGDDFDKAIVVWLAEGFKSKEGIDLLQDRETLQRLTEAAEKAETGLSGVL